MTAGGVNLLCPCRLSCFCCPSAVLWASLEWGTHLVPVKARWLRVYISTRQKKWLVAFLQKQPFDSSLVHISVTVYEVALAMLDFRTLTDKSSLLSISMRPTGAPSHNLAWKQVAASPARLNTADHKDNSHKWRLDYNLSP